MKKLLIATLFVTAPFAIQAAELPKECNDYFDKVVAQAKAQGASEADAKAAATAASQQFETLLPQMGGAAVAQSCKQAAAMLDQAMPAK